MEISTQVTLIAETYTTDGIGQKIPTETRRNVLGRLHSVTRTEWAEAGRLGLNAAYQVVLFAPDYNGEKIAVVDGKRYGIYRTYRGSNATIELYLEEKAGV